MQFDHRVFTGKGYLARLVKSEVFDLLFSRLSAKAAYARFFEMNFCFSVFLKKLLAATHEQS